MEKVLLVTGGSRGIGAATSLLAARQGWAVAVNYTANSLAADEVVRQIRAAGGRAMAVQADVADEAQVLRMFEQRRRGRCDRSGGRHERGALETDVRHQRHRQPDLRP